MGRTFLDAVPAVGAELVVLDVLLCLRAVVCDRPHLSALAADVQSLGWLESSVENANGHE